ncbi:major facilitator superfamily domain-containing protein [Aspergillus ambiguus]|uniref:major facilitator superfamily domain-containing protein n=1 Tax=Aspergillus ambiguus TaxID=176160 RepID=UPI003CCE3CB0
MYCQASGPPNGGYGWVCVACGCAITTHTFGIVGAFGVFLSHYLDANVYPGTSPMVYALIGGISCSQGWITSPLAATITRLWGTRSTLLLGIVLQTLGLILASFSTQIWHLILTQGLLCGFGMLLLYIECAYIPAQWFSTKRSFATGLTVAGSGLGGAVYSLAARSMISNIGLPWAFRALAIITFVVNGVSALLIRDRNKEIGTRSVAFDWRLFRRLDYLLVLAWAAPSMMMFIILGFSLSDYARSIGLTSSQGALITALFNIGQIFGRLGVGFISDMFGRIRVATMFTFFNGVLCFIFWKFATSYASIAAFSIVSGLFSPTVWSALAPVVTEVVGVEGVQNGMTMCWIVISGPILASEPIALAIGKNTSIGYLGIQMLTGALSIGSALSLGILDMARRCKSSAKIEEE